MEPLKDFWAFFAAAPIMTTVWLLSLCAMIACIIMYALIT
jgi:hypothetical protein